MNALIIMSIDNILTRLNEFPQQLIPGIVVSILALALPEVLATPEFPRLQAVINDTSRWPIAREEFEIIRAAYLAKPSTHLRVLELAAKVVINCSGNGDSYDDSSLYVFLDELKRASNLSDEQLMQHVVGV